MEKYDIEKLHTEFFNGRITYDEFVTGLCISEVGEEKFSNYDLIEGDLYIYCTDDTIKVIRDFY